MTTYGVEIAVVNRGIETVTVLRLPSQVLGGADAVRLLANQLMNIAIKMDRIHGAAQ